MEKKGCPLEGEVFDQPTAELLLAAWTVIAFAVVVVCFGVLFAIGGGLS